MKRRFSDREVPLFDSKRTASRMEKDRFSAAAAVFVKETDNRPPLRCPDIFLSENEKGGANLCRTEINM